MWAEEEIQQQLDGTVRNKKVFKDMADRMAEAGYIRTAEQLRDKLKKVKRDYKDARSNKESSGAGRQQCSFYDILHQILGHRSTMEPEVLIDTADNKSQDNQGQGGDEADAVLPVPPPALAPATDVEEANPAPENHEAEQSTSSDGSTPRTIGKRKRRQSSTSSRQEEAMDKMAKRLIDHQDVARRENREWEERREEEQERREDRTRQEERDHEIRLFQMMGQMLQQQQKFVTTPAGRSYMDM